MVRDASPDGIWPRDGDPAELHHVEDEIAEEPVARRAIDRRVKFAIRGSGTAPDRESGAVALSATRRGPATVSPPICAAIGSQGVNALPARIGGVRSVPRLSNA
jgi:hypothetical protein